MMTAPACCARHVFQMDAAERRVADTQNEFAPFFEHYVGGTRQEIVTSSSRNFRQRPDGAGNHGHCVDCKAAGGYCSANIFIGNDGNFAGTVTENPLHQLFGIAGSDRQFFGKKPQPSFGDDQMNALDARIGVEQCQHFLREHSAACAGHTYSNDFLVVFAHVFAADNFSLAADLRQVKQRRACLAVIEFCNGLL